MNEKQLTGEKLSKINFGFYQGSMQRQQFNKNLL